MVGEIINLLCSAGFQVRSGKMFNQEVVSGLPIVMHGWSW
jgi:hypothetical protein